MGLFNTGEIYLHYNPEHIHHYRTSKATMINKITDKNRIKSLMVKTFAKKDNLSNEEIEAYFDFLGGFGKPGVLQQAIQAQVNQLDLTTLRDSFGEYDNFYHAFESIKTLPDVVQYSTVLLPQITKLNNQLLQGVDSVNWKIIDDYLAQAVQRGYLAAPPSSSKEDPQLGKMLENIYNSNREAIAYKPKSQMNNVNLKHFLVLQRLLEKLAGGQISASSINNKMLQYFISIFVNRYNQIMGFAYQTILSTFPDIVIDNLIINFCETGGENVNLTYTHKTGERNINKVVKTQDFSIQALIQENSDKPMAKVISNFKLPGASVKFSSGMLTNAKTSNVKIKTKDVVLGHLLHNLDNNLLYWIYNILGSYQRTYRYVNQAGKATTRKSTITKNMYYEAWDAIKKAATINGLIGQMSSDDFSYYFIISKKVYTVPEIIDMMIGATTDNAEYSFGISGGNTMRLNPTQIEIRKQVSKYETQKATTDENAHYRSKQALDMMLSAHIKAGLSFKIKRLR